MRPTYPSLIERDAGRAPGWTVRNPEKRLSEASASVAPAEIQHAGQERED